MYKRILIIIFVLVGIAFLIPSNPYTDPFTAPTIKGVKKTFSYFDDKIDLPDVNLPAKTTTVHKWQDKDGKWHYSNTEAPKAIDSERIIYKDDVNVMPAIETKSKK